MSAENLREALVEEIRDLYNAEKQLVKALPKMAKGAESDELRDAFEQHLQETEGQVTRLERVFELLEEKPRGKHCAGMAGIIEEGSEKLQEDMEGSVLDACLIGAAQKVEHYEICAYGTAVAWAEALGLSEVVDVLNETLEEEKAADEKLTALAESGINQAATAGESEEDEEGGEMEEDEDEEEETVSRAGSRGRQPEQPQASASGGRQAATGSKSARARGGRR
jgi:ferritin-like metal-binding protein YciE